MADEETNDITYEWFVPDTLSITDPEKQGPTVVDIGGLADVIIGTNWAVRGTHKDGTIDTIAHYTKFTDADPKNFLAFDDISEKHLWQWLFAPPEGSGPLNKLDQEGQIKDRIRTKQIETAKAGPKALNPNAKPPAPQPDSAEEEVPEAPPAPETPATP